MSWHVRVPKRVSKTIKTFPRSDTERLLVALRAFEQNPWIGDVVKIQGEHDIWRKRIGSYRIFYSIDIDDKVVAIKEISRRTSATY